MSNILDKFNKLSRDKIKFQVMAKGKDRQDSELEQKIIKSHNIIKNLLNNTTQLIKIDTSTEELMIINAI